MCLDDFETDWFVRMNNTGGPVDVWAVDGVDRLALLDNGNGHLYVAGTVPVKSLTLLRRSVPVQLLEN